MKCTQRLYLTADRKKVVEEGHKKAATLYAVPGDEIPQEAHDRFGLIDGHLKGFDPNVEADGEPEAPPPSEPTIVAKQALFHSTAAPDTLVPEGHDDAGQIYAKPGDLIPQSAHDGFGLVDGALPAFDQAAFEAKAKALAAEADAYLENIREKTAAANAGKEAPGPADKDAAPAHDKEQRPDGDKVKEGAGQAGVGAGAQA